MRRLSLANRATKPSSTRTAKSGVGLKGLCATRRGQIRISPSANPEKGIVDYTMACHSGGTLDIYIEPVLPKPQLVNLGRSVVAQILARLGKAIHFEVCVAGAEPGELSGHGSRSRGGGLEPYQNHARNVRGRLHSGGIRRGGAPGGSPANAPYVAFVGQQAEGTEDF